MSTPSPQDNNNSPLGSIVSNIGKDFQTVTPLLMIASRINIPPGQLVIGGFVLVFMCVVFGFASSFLTALIGILYPAYMSFKAVGTQGDDDDDKFWLTYWVVFSFLHVTDGLFSVFLSFIPFYYPLKVLVYVYLFYPKTKGALTIYNNFLKGFLQAREAKIDNLINKGKEAVEKTVRKTIVE